MISAQERDYAGRDRLLLTVTFPIKENLTASFRAAMLSFPQGSVQQVLRACLKSFDKRETVIDNRGKRVGDEENASISE